ncbi:CXXC-type zinc finger protein 1-like [Culicoides brevitarsis]|uniref:CXXC-type zinc finger protein 1-like n=1 Tax=Culicoides brevitarsis TaxID=469753 RepID=UPI00307B44DF
MSEKRSKKSKEEIARQFDLPERKSKIATILQTQDVAYCICRSSDSSRFMICCDACEEWYHGDCINITEKEAKHIKQYFCIACKEKDPSLQVVFRPVPQAPSVQQPSHSARDAGGHSYSSKKADDKKLKKRKEHKAAKHQRDDKKIAASRPKKRKRSVTPEIVLNPALTGIRQCHGPGCIMNARPQSKYCSDDCGMQLQTARIYQVLPNRINEWGMTPSKAEELNAKALDSIRSKMAIVQATLSELDKRHTELDLLVERAKRCQIDPRAAEIADNDADEASMYCITCGHEIHSKFAIRHMEKCFNKYESQASFGSIYRTRIEGNSMFCDFFNPASQTYCKRLKVLCPEHSKDPKVNDTDVCGCPLVKKVFTLTGEFCRAPKKSCYKHFVWEKIRRAEIDLERVRQWLKMDELIEQERQCRMAMKARASVMGLLLHSTYNHEIMDRLMAKSNN